jgi:predicted DNA-binding transcriptional regulator YafY
MGLAFTHLPDEGDDALERLLQLVLYFRDLDRVSLARLAGALSGST